jgi:hypothetical protein
VTDRVRSDRRKDSLLAHCIARAVAADRGHERTKAELEAGTLKVRTWTAAKVTPKASRVAAFIVQWALAMRDERAATYTITEYQHYWHEGERQTYRRQAEFRELWPEYETPNELAAQVVKYLRTHDDAGVLPLSVPVVV